MLNLRLSDSPCSKPNSKPTQQQPGIARVLYIIMWQLCCTQHTKYQDHNVYQQQALKETGNEYPQSLVFASVSVLHIIIAGGVPVFYLQRGSGYVSQQRSAEFRAFFVAYV